MTFIPDPNNRDHYLAQKFFHDFPGASRETAMRAWQYAKQCGLDDAQTYRYTAEACGYGPNGPPLTDQQKQAAKWSNVDEQTYSRELRRLNELKAAGHIQT